MHNCIFTPHCMEEVCDRSCPRLVETSYLLERNGISENSQVFNTSPKIIRSILDTLEFADGTMKLVIANNTVVTAEQFTYCAICKNWQGSQLHCTVYNLKYSKYIEELKKSWSSHSESEELEYMRIFASTAKVLIISNVDFVNFSDFESQTLLNLIQSREGKQKTTLVVSPRVDSLIGRGQFFTRLQEVLRGAVIRR